MSKHNIDILTRTVPLFFSLCTFHTLAAVDLEKGPSSTEIQTHPTVSPTKGHNHQGNNSNNSSCQLTGECTCRVTGECKPCDKSVIN